MLDKTKEKSATLYRMVTPEHVCPFGLKSLDLLQREGFDVDDRQLKSRAEADSFMEKERVKTTPQTFVAGSRVGGYDDLREYFHKPVSDPNETSYQPVIAVFATSLAMALAATWASTGSLISARSLEWFIAFSMCVLAILKLRDLEAFSNMFLGYDLLAQRYVQYAYVYPFGEVISGALMIAGGPLKWFAIPIAFVIGTIGAVSVFKAVYIDKRELKCACVGGNSNVPLGFISLTENVMMVVMSVWMALK